MTRLRISIFWPKVKKFRRRKQIFERAVSNLKRLCPVLDTTSENASEQTFYEYICHSPEEFELLEASGKFACTGENLSDQNKVALAKQLIDQNCLEGFGSLCELPVTAALSMRLSESYKPQVFLFLPKESEYFSKLEARFGEGSGDNQDSKILEKLKEEYFSILSIHENNPGMFKLVLSLEDTDILVNHLFSMLEGQVTNSSNHSTVSNSGNSGRNSVSGASNCSNLSQVHTGRRDTITIPQHHANTAILSSDLNARRAHLAEQTRRRMHVAANKQMSSHTLIVGANLVFELSKNTLKKRMQQALSAISKTGDLIEKSDVLKNSGLKNCEFDNGFKGGMSETSSVSDEGLEFDQFLVGGASASTCEKNNQSRMTSATPDWEAEGIIVLPDDAQTLSNGPASDRNISSAGLSSRCSSKRVLPPLNKSPKRVGTTETN